MAATGKWRTSEDSNLRSGRIGPNAILQMLPVLDRVFGPDRCSRMLAAAGLSEIPDGRSMIPETDAARLHRRLRVEAPRLAPRIAADAGFATADYILANRIPWPAQLVLKALPAGPSARLLSRAIAQHAWTFAGSGDFHVVDRWTFELGNNPLILGETSGSCLCHWHAAVFEGLYRALVSPGCRCEETRCAAQGFGHRCRFRMHR